MFKFLVTLVLSVFLMGNLNAQEKSKEGVTKLYVATFNRAPDSDGISYWLNSSLTLEEVSKSFFDQPETKDLYPDGHSNTDFIVAVYGNLFNRNPDDKGLRYWSSELSSSATRDAKGDLEANIITRDNFILAVINGAQGNDATILSNKTEVGLAFSNSGDNDVPKAKDIMKDITADRDSVNKAMKKLGDPIKPTPPPGDPIKPTPPPGDPIKPTPPPGDPIKLPPGGDEDDDEIGEIRLRSATTSQNVDIKYLTKDNLLRVTEYLNNAGYKSFATKTIDSVESDFDVNDKEYYIVTFKEGGYIVFDTNINANAIYSFDENSKYNTISDENLKIVSLDWMSIIAEEVEVPLSQLRRSTRSSSRRLITKIVWKSGYSRTDFDLFVKNAKGEICAYYKRDRSQWGTKHLHDDRGSSYKTSYEAFSVDLDKMDEYSTSINNFGNYKFYVSRYAGPNISYNFSYGMGGECFATNATNCPKGNWKRNVSNTGIRNALYAVRYTPKRVSNTSNPSYTARLINNIIQTIKNKNGRWGGQCKAYLQSNFNTNAKLFKINGQSVTMPQNIVTWKAKSWKSTNSFIAVKSYNASGNKNVNKNNIKNLLRQVKKGDYIQMYWNPNSSKKKLTPHTIIAFDDFKENRNLNWGDSNLNGNEIVRYGTKYPWGSTKTFDSLANYLSNGFCTNECGATLYRINPNITKP